MPKPPKHQYSLELIQHHVASSVIDQRAADGYINATQLCHAAGKRWHQYVREEVNGQFLRALAKKEGVAVAALTPELTSEAGAGSVWAHPKVAIHLAQWLSAEFAVQVADWVFAWLDTGVAPRTGRSGKMPYHLERHVANMGKVPPTHFSILQEMTTTLIAPLEVHGYTLPDNMLPDISQGRLFCKFARQELDLDTDSLPTYRHTFPDGREVDAKLYPVEHLGAFRKFINEVWMPERAAEYFGKRDPQALPLLDKVLKIAYEPPRAPTRRRSPAKKRA